MQAHQATGRMYAASVSNYASAHRRAREQVLHGNILIWMCIVKGFSTGTSAATLYIKLAPKPNIALFELESECASSLSYLSLMKSKKHHRTTGVD